MSDGHRQHLLRDYLHRRCGRLGDAIYLFIGGFLMIALSGFVAYLLNQPLLFPSLGPTVYLHFESPLSEGASPRSTIIGHIVALAAGYLSLAAFGLLNAPNVLQTGVLPYRIGAAALSVALTIAFLHLFRSPHAPAGATTLIVSLGLLPTPRDLLDILIGVCIVTIAAWVFHRASGVPMPVWSAKNQRES